MTSFTLRRNFNAKFEPVDTVLHGAGQDVNAFREYTELFSDQTRPLIYMTYTGISGEVEHVINWAARTQNDLSTLRQDSVYLQIGVAMTGGRDTGAGRDHLVAAGDRDENIIALCDALNSIGMPAFIRIGYEFEGEWNGYTPESYVAAFRRVTRIMRERNVNAATVWCSSGTSVERDITFDEAMAYYPGDMWVDWWGIDPFNADEMLDKPMRHFCEAAGAHNKPVMIGESTPRKIGVLDGQASWDAWFNPYFTLIRRQPEIKAFCYINWEWVYWSDTLGFRWHHWGDCRIEQNPVVLAHFRDEMRLPLYAHYQPESS